MHVRIFTSFDSPKAIKKSQVWSLPQFASESRTNKSKMNCVLALVVLGATCINGQQLDDLYSKDEIVTGFLQTLEVSESSSGIFNRECVASVHKCIREKQKLYLRTRRPYRGW